MIQKRFKRQHRSGPDGPIQSNPTVVFLNNLTWFDSLEEWLKLGSICSYCGKTKNEAVKGGGMTIFSSDCNKSEDLGKVARLCGDCAKLVP